MADKEKIPYGNLGKKVAEALTQLTDATNVPQRYGQTATVRSTSAVGSISQEAENSQETSAYKALQLPPVPVEEQEKPMTVEELRWKTPEEAVRERNGETGTEGTQVDIETANGSNNANSVSQIANTENAPEEKKAPALERLGVKIAEPIVDTNMDAEQLVNYARSARTSERELQKKIKQLKPSAAERQFAQGLAAGTYVEGDPILASGELLAGVNMNKVRELADYYRASDAFKEDRIGQRRRQNRHNEEYIAQELTKHSDSYKGLSALRLNLNTMQRNIEAMVGGEEAVKKTCAANLI